MTLNRPHRLNAFDETMCQEFEQLWRSVADDDAVNTVVVRGAGDRAFSTGVDVSERIYQPPNAWSHRDPGARLGPKANLCWKPVVCAVHGMAAGGAFYWINEADIVICSEDATFFEPHTSYGMTAALEPIGLLHKIPVGEVLRMALLGSDERMSAEKALQISLVTEVVPRADLWTGRTSWPEPSPESPPWRFRERCVRSGKPSTSAAKRVSTEASTTPSSGITS